MKFSIKKYIISEKIFPATPARFKAYMFSSEDYKQKSANELIEIVDENNYVLEPTTRAVMRANKLIHRATYAFIKNKCNYFYVQKRSDLKGRQNCQYFGMA